MSITHVHLALPIKVLILVTSWSPDMHILSFKNSVAWAKLYFKNFCKSKANIQILVVLFPYFFSE